MNFKNHTITEPSGEFATAIRNFRAALTHLAERESARPMAADWLAPARKRRRSHQHRLILAWACAAALCVAALPFAPLPFGHQPEPATVTRAAIEPAGSAALGPKAATERTLLEQVDEQVSEPVPSSLAPLAEMDNWGNASTNTASDSSLGGMSLALSEGTNASR